MLQQEPAHAAEKFVTEKSIRNALKNQFRMTYAPIPLTHNTLGARKAVLARDLSITSFQDIAFARRVNALMLRG